MEFTERLCFYEITLHFIKAYGKILLTDWIGLVSRAGLASECDLSTNARGTA